jgi:hypothetical protein
MEAERWFKRELEAIVPGVYPLWFPHYGKWMLVRDFDRKIGGLTDSHPVHGTPVIVELVLEDEQHRALALTRPVLEMVRQLMWEKNHHDKIDHVLRRGHEREERRAAMAHRQRLLQQRDFLKKAYYFIHSETFVMPSKAIPGATKGVITQSPPADQKGQGEQT